MRNWDGSDFPGDAYDFWKTNAPDEEIDFDETEEEEEDDGSEDSEQGPAEPQL